MPPARRRARRAARVPRRAARRPRAARRVRRGRSSEFVEAAPDGDANLLYTVHKGGFVLRRPVPARHPQGPGRRPRAAAAGLDDRDPRAAGSWAGCSGSPRARLGYRHRRPRPRPGLPGRVGRRRDRRRRATTTSRPRGGWPRWRDVVTYELEHVGLDAAAAAGELAPLRPGLAALRATQDRLAERRFIREIGECAAPWREVRGVDDARAAADALGYPLRLKVPIGGYDGRSQARIADARRGRGGGAGARRRAGRPLLLERGDRLRGRAVGGLRPRPRGPVARRSRPRATSTTPGILVESVAPAPIHPLVAVRRPRDRRLARRAASTSSAC